MSRDSSEELPLATQVAKRFLLNFILLDCFCLVHFVEVEVWQLTFLLQLKSSVYLPVCPLSVLDDSSTYFILTISFFFIFLVHFFLFTSKEVQIILRPEFLKFQC